MVENRHDEFPVPVGINAALRYTRELTVAPRAPRISPGENDNVDLGIIDHPPDSTRDSLATTKLLVVWEHMDPVPAHEFVHSTSARSNLVSGPRKLKNTSYRDPPGLPSMPSSQPASISALLPSLNHGHNNLMI